MRTATDHRAYLGVARPDIADAEIEAVVATLRSGWLTSGPQVRAFEGRLSEVLGAPHVRCLSSCTAGLMLGLRLAGVGPGDEVIVPAVTFVACANVIEHAGARPVLVDCDPATGLLDLDAAEAAISRRTRVLMPVHLGGHPIDLDRVGELARRHGLAVLEDAAHAIGAAWRGRRIGAHGNLCSFSFHATKNMTTFEGGALVVRDVGEADRVRRLALHGLDRSAWNRHRSGAPDRYDVVEPGFKLGMTDVGAAVGLRQLDRLDSSVDRREALCRAYDEQLTHLPLELLPAVPDHARHARHLYMVRVPPGAGCSRDELISGLQERMIGSSVHFRAIHLFSYYRERYAIHPASLPQSSAWSDQALTLPLHPHMTDDDVAYVAGALGELLAVGRAR